jgi:hypothetical protein
MNGVPLTGAAAALYSLLQRLGLLTEKANSPR